MQQAGRPERGRPGERPALVHRGDTGHAATLPMDLLLGLQHLVEGHEPHCVAALVQAVVVEARDLHAIDARLLTNALGHLGDGGAGHPGRLHS